MTKKRTLTTSHKNVLDTISILYTLKGFQIAEEEPDIAECERIDELMNEILEQLFSSSTDCEITMDRQSYLAIWSRLYDYREVYRLVSYTQEVLRTEALMDLFQ